MPATAAECCPPSTFTGRDELISRLDAAVAHADTEAITSAVRDTLVEMIAGGRLELPHESKRPAEGSYARRLVYQSPQHGYVVIAMVWGPQQGTALHDHDGVWCVEGVVEGEIEVTQYDRVEVREEKYRFAPQGSVKAGLGSAGSLIPPFEYHTIKNSLEDGRSTVTLHIYGRELRKAHIFAPEGDGWYQRTVRQLGYAD
jgi:predicted metal-dependent enzyme (double-stranded beta helix superfamily)